METFLDAATIHRLSRKKLKHIKGLMLFKSISCRITSKGIRDQEIEGYRL
jgi:hypothetical protein